MPPAVGREPSRPAPRGPDRAGRAPARGARRRSRRAPPARPGRAAGPGRGRGSPVRPGRVRVVVADHRRGADRPRRRASHPAPRGSTARRTAPAASTRPSSASRRASSSASPPPAAGARNLKPPQRLREARRQRQLPAVAEGAPLRLEQQPGGHLAPRHGGHAARR